MRHDGGLLIALGAILGLGVAIYNFLAPVALLAPESSIAWTPGAALMIFSTFVLMLLGLVLGGGATHPVVVGLVALAALLAIVGTGFAAWMLDSTVLVALMLVCLLGWLMRVLSGRPEPA